jgi:hypothetical protein
MANFVSAICSSRRSACSRSFWIWALMELSVLWQSVQKAISRFPPSLCFAKCKEHGHSRQTSPAGDLLIDCRLNGCANLFPLDLALSTLRRHPIKAVD